MAESKTEGVIKRVIIVGRAASGKDYLRMAFQKAGFVYQVGYTTRQPRVGEEHGIDYFFVTEEKFNHMTEQELWHEKVVFNGNQYGTRKDQFHSDETCVFIMSPEGLRSLNARDRKESLIVFLNMDSKSLESRLKARRMSLESIARRQLADRQFDSYVVGGPGIVVTHPTFDADRIVQQAIQRLDEKRARALMDLVPVST